MSDLSGKLILVTGASSGLGRSISQKAAEKGARIILLGRNEARLAETFNSLTGSGHSYYSLDITDYDILTKTVQIATEKSGPISGFVHSAGMDKTIPFRLSKPSLFNEIFQINVFAGFELARIISYKNHFGSDGASFVFLSSVLGRLGEFGKTAYCASKSALLAGVRSMALELAEKKIRCNTILPGVVETEMINSLFDSMTTESKNSILKRHPLGLGVPDDVAFLVTFLLSNEARWITGAEYVIDGGYSIY